MSGVRIVWRGLTLILILSILGFLASVAQATFPGQNGPLLVSASTPSSGAVWEPQSWSRLYELKLDGSSRAISPVNTTYYSPRISPNGRLIVFVRNPGDQLWLGPRRNPAAAVQITDETQGIGAASPVFSPDGKSIYFTSVLNDRSPAWRISRYRIRSREVETLTDIYFTDNPLSPAVSSDGKLIAFNTGNSDSSRIRIMRTQGGAGWEVDTPGPAFVGSFSPDGKRLAYARKVGAGQEIFVSRLDGSGAKRLTNSGTQNYGPRFSPDGRKVAYGTGVDTYSTIEIYDLLTGRSREITAPGQYVGQTQWLRQTLFRVKGYSRKKGRLKLRVFNPGVVKVFGKGIKVSGTRTGARRHLSIKLRWRPKAKRANLTVRFKPNGALAGTRKISVRR